MLSQESLAAPRTRQEELEIQLAEAQGSLAVLRRRAAAYDMERKAVALVHGSWVDSLAQPQRLMRPGSDAARAGALSQRDSHLRIVEMH